MTKKRVGMGSFGLRPQDDKRMVLRFLVAVLSFEL